MLRLAARAASALALATAVALTTAAPALADPPAPIPVPPPKAADIVGVGSSVTQSLFNQFSGDYNASLTAAGDSTSPRLYSWDSTGSNTITPKTGADTIVRPFESSAGITALSATTSRTLDFSRDTRTPQFGDPVTTLFVAMAKDAVSWAAPTGGNAPANLTTAQLGAIYSCQITNWRQISSALPDATIRPVVAGHMAVDRNGAYGLATDTTTYFLAKINYHGILLNDNATDHSCVSVVERGNQGTDPVLHDPNAVVPYSVGRYLGQAYGGHTGPGDEPGALVPRALNGIQPISTTSISATFAASPYGYVLYNTVRAAEWNGSDAHTQALRRIFSVIGWICRDPAALAGIRSHGFLVIPPGACGSITHM
ncbi:substrate-binding domain-containing protein [Kitasatospora sp. NBC_00458]|uniref:substrate-binding domain-containing protein n=1 Tax=Kitasatospora sp. NBC_00458 TaxID=2903568 RepID=UPI002E19649B